MKGYDHDIEILENNPEGLTVTSTPLDNTIIENINYTGELKPNLNISSIPVRPPPLPKRKSETEETTLKPISKETIPLANFKTFVELSREIQDLIVDSLRKHLPALSHITEEEARDASRQQLFDTCFSLDSETQSELWSRVIGDIEASKTKLVSKISKADSAEQKATELKARLKQRISSFDSVRSTAHLAQAMRNKEAVTKNLNKDIAPHSFWQKIWTSKVTPAVASGTAAGLAGTALGALIL